MKGKKVNYFRLGDPVPHAEYKIKLVAKRGIFKRAQVDETSIAFKRAPAS